MRTVDEPVMAALIGVRPHPGGQYTYYRWLRDRLTTTDDVRVHEVPFMPAASRSLARLFARIVHGADRYRARIVDLGIAAQAREIDRGTTTTGDNFHVVHTQHATGSMAVWRSRLRDVPVVQTVHSFWEDEWDRSGVSAGSAWRARLAAIEAEARLRTSLFLVSNEPHRARLVASGVDGNRVEVVRHVPPIPDDCLELGGPIGDGPLRLAVVGRLSPEKGVDVALRAMTETPEDIAGHLMIVGAGPERARLEHIANELAPGGDRVTFAGAVDHREALRLMARVDLVLMPSVPVADMEEACGYSALEALAMGRFAIASRVGGTPEYIPETGFSRLVPPGDVAALAEAIRDVARLDADQRAAGSREAREWARRTLSPQDWTDRIVAAYRRVARNR